MYRPRNRSRNSWDFEFACEKDAQAAADHWVKNHPWYRLTHLAVVPVSRKIELKRRRPRKDEERLTVHSIQAEIARMSEVILAENETPGRFILASDDLCPDHETRLDQYKNQSAVERGFRLLKDKRFQNLRDVFEKAGENRSTFCGHGSDPSSLLGGGMADSETVEGTK